MKREKEKREKAKAGVMRFCLAGMILLSGCSSAPRQSAPITTPTAPASTTASGSIVVPAGQPSAYSCNYTPLSQTRGGFYKDDGPLELPAGLDQIPEPFPRDEPLHRWANNPYNVLGQNFIPRKQVGDYTGQGIASWYGRKFHGQKTSSGEVYDMFRMTAAHPTLPIPSYARVTNLKNNRSVIVRINDRGPFLKGREIDLSFLAACRLGYATQGSVDVEVISLRPGESASGQPLSPASTTEPTITLPPITAPAAAEAVTAGQEVFLQFGAFGSRGNAENFLAHLQRELEEIHIARLGIQQSGAVYRVRLGPFPDRATALAEAEKLTGKTNLPVVITR